MLAVLSEPKVQYDSWPAQQQSFAVLQQSVVGTLWMPPASLQVAMYASRLLHAERLCCKIQHDRRHDVNNGSSTAQCTCTQCMHQANSLHFVYPSPSKASAIAASACRVVAMAG
jgi:hypothetical protein